MSKQYLTTHTVDNAHPAAIFSLAATPTSLLTASGSAHLKIYSTQPNAPAAAPQQPRTPFPLVQTLDRAHPLGCHHVTAVAFDVVNAKGGNGGGRTRGERAASAGFGGEVRLWRRRDDGSGSEWEPLGDGLLVPAQGAAAVAAAAGGADKGKAGSSGVAAQKQKKAEVWALALSVDGRFLAATTHDGRVPVWDLGDPTVEADAGKAAAVPEKIREYETAASSGAGSAGGPGSFGLCVALSGDGRWTAVGCVDGRVYVFDNDKGRMVHSLSGLTKPIRAVSFSPGSTRLACAGDAGVIALYDMKSRAEHVGNLAPSTSSADTGLVSSSTTSSSTANAWITSLDWSASGEHLLSGAMDGRVRVWNVERQACVATHAETDAPLWAVRWLLRPPQAAAAMRVAEHFVAAGENRSLTFYREATGSG